MGYTMACIKAADHADANLLLTCGKHAAVYTSLEIPPFLYSHIMLKENVRTYLLKCWPVWAPR